jgi:hypothetical protein
MALCSSGSGRLLRIPLWDRAGEDGATNSADLSLASRGLRNPFRVS